ncbi:1-aminocyclopropane-1-carboxylate deaminase/D-cysteine desulfhydrase [Flagellimonas sp. CMM7]|uniref:1-aminocyclopropane-1-carboxylate deaminase/D-cysteine desulfhydrase n=1 Tax=Flagellimonas sp. CMM7 TaxID=2654676 RepID=UPI0013D257D4|nr:pyridoxal-phosphate dependent enzyme [Flagellimonas sp. CMM7]UII79918.1 pyridoxal-phosphate dependent enzyme [Flagellimonas sp. CMM7]
MEINTIENQIFVVRDDLFPSLGGGNKGRKLDYIGRKLKEDGFNAVVTTGGIQSNHCRATAIFAAQNKLACTLVIHGDPDRFYAENGNAKLMRDAGVKIIFARTEEISDAMDSSMIDYQSLGLNPYYLKGGGHTLEGGTSYLDAVGELLENSNVVPDYFFLASGTGSTQAGIMAGLTKHKCDCNVIGVSVARKRLRAEEIVTKFYHELCENQKIEGPFDKEAVVLDDYLFGGYEKYNDDIEKVSQRSIMKYGFTLDTTYTAKAFFGMQDYIKKNDIKGHIFFWHTGGVLNYLAKK